MSVLTKSGKASDIILNSLDGVSENCRSRFLVTPQGSPPSSAGRCALGVWLWMCVCTDTHEGQLLHTPLVMFLEGQVRERAGFVTREEC